MAEMIQAARHALRDMFSANGTPAPTEGKLFTQTQLTTSLYLFVLWLFLSHRIMKRGYGSIEQAQITSRWPFSIGDFRIPAFQELLLAAAVVLFFQFVLHFLLRTRFRLMYVLPIGVALVVGSNLVLGPALGFGDVVLESGTGYFLDAVEIEDPADFLRNYVTYQPELRRHTQTHPAGSVLVYYALAQVSINAEVVGLIWSAGSTALLIAFWYGLVRHFEEDEERAGFMTFLLVVLPSTVLFTAFLDSLIAALLLGGLYFFVRRGDLVDSAIAGLLIGAAFFLSFGALFIFPVLGLYELLHHRHVKRVALTTAVVGLVFVLLFVLSGYNHLASFQVASAIENPDGFRLLANPYEYFGTRLENVYENIVFLGPALIMLIGRGLRGESLLRNEALLLAGAGVLALLAMFASGAFRTGETARAAMFIYPYLLLPVMVYLKRVNFSPSTATRLLHVVFGQAILMRLFTWWLG